MTTATMPQQPKRVAQPSAQSPMVAIRAYLQLAFARVHEADSSEPRTTALQEGAQQQQREPEAEQTVDGRPDHLNLRGGCPGKFCG